MHVLPAALIGGLVALGVMVETAESFVTLLYTPAIVSGVTLLLCLVPERKRS